MNRGFSLFFVVMSFSFGLWAEPISVPKDLKKTALAFRAQVKAMKAQDCASELKDIYLSLYNFKPTYFENLESLSSPLSENPLNIFFRTRLALHDKFRKWSWQKGFGADNTSGYKKARECGRMIKVANRALRGFEEYWGLYQLEKNTAGGELQSPGTFQGQWPYRMLRPKYKQGYSFPNKQDSFSPGSLKTGDMFLTRGTAFSSAAISRIGDVDNQFSHLALVWIDKEGAYEHYDAKKDKLYPAKKNQVFLLESLLEGGVQVSIMEEWATHQFGRLVHFRYVGDGSKSESELDQIRQQAAEILFKNAKIPHGQAGHINYNYPMDMADTETLFCSQAVSYAYKKSCEKIAGQGDVDQVCPRPSYTPESRLYPFPLVYSKLPVDQNPLVQVLGITGREVFAPADIEIDPQVEVIAEWRNYSLIEGRRIHDMAITKLFQWMERGGYHFREDVTSFESLVDVGELLVKTLEKMPPETPRGFVKGTALLGFLVEAPGVQEQAVDLFIERAKDKDAAAVAELLKGLGLGIPEARIESVIDVVHPVLMKMIESGQLKRFLTYRGFSSRLEDEAKDFRQSTGFPATDFVFDRSMEKLRIKYCDDYQKGIAVRMHDFFAESFVSREKACQTTTDDYKRGGRFDWRTLW